VAAQGDHCKPSDLAPPEVDAVVVSLKSRSIEAGLAVTPSRGGKWLRCRGADHAVQDLAHFDSTDAAISARCRDRRAPILAGLLCCW
jgi:uncharacterized protein YgbK (DUF1537 family)